MPSPPRSFYLKDFILKNSTILHQNKQTQHRIQEFLQQLQFGMALTEDYKATELSVNNHLQ
jgi:hypothetical protein